MMLTVLTSLTREIEGVGSNSEIVFPKFYTGMAVGRRCRVRRMFLMPPQGSPVVMLISRINDYWRKWSDFLKRRLQNPTYSVHFHP